MPIPHKLTWSTSKTYLHTTCSTIDLIELDNPKYWDERYRFEQQVTQNGEQSTLDSVEWFRSLSTFAVFLKTAFRPPLADAMSSI